MNDKPVLLSLIELGGYPNFTPLYQQAGYEVLPANSVRKALGLLKKQVPDVIVAEFNFQTDFRDRSSTLESLLAVVQRHPGIHVIIFYEKDYENHLPRLTDHFPVFATIPFPVDPEVLLKHLRIEG
ncbi:MAG: hypothetical protein BMS9Abin36_0935 [Gammaproteobacteria bacterium]|nr:MAG: hypothetical protein BMS9Abin36_0935 [Gammaproteobacteria bacterium]